MDFVAAGAVGVLAGVVAGLLGVGGGILFVPALSLILGLNQVEAEATSLLAIIPVSLLGAVRQHRYGNVRVADGLLVGVLSALGVLAGVAVANALPERTLKLAFALLAVGIAARLVRRGLDQRRARLAPR
jgi:uncharacterized protein